MLNTKRMRFPIDIILVCIRWYAGYPLGYRHIEEMMQERGVFVDHSSINRWAVAFCRYLKKLSASTNGQLVGAGEWTRRILR
jgi:transposase-like protein